VRRRNLSAAVVEPGFVGMGGNGGREQGGCCLGDAVWLKDWPFVLMQEWASDLRVCITVCASWVWTLRLSDLHYLLMISVSYCLLR